MKLKWQAKSKIDKAGIKAVKLLQKSNFQAFWVGGIVRNILLKRESDNVDIATDAKPEEIEKVLDAAEIKSKPVGKQFGSILTVIDGVLVEITTFRSEGRYSDQRHPDQVKFIKEYLDDAKRRDFTINALYFDPIKKDLFDPTGRGIKDQESRIIRFVGDPKKRIDEDALRMLRGVRLAVQLGFKLEKNSFAAIKTRAKYIQGISGERIKAELDKILLSEHPAAGIEVLDKIGLLKFIIPEIEPIKIFSHKSKLYHLEGTIFDHTLLALEKAKHEPLEVLYALLFHDIGKPQKAQRVLKDEGWVISIKGHADSSADIFLKFAQALKFPSQSKRTIQWLIRNHMLMTNFLDMKPVKQLRLASQPAFEMLLRHWSYDEAATKRVDPSDTHHKKYLQSLTAGKNLLSKLEKLAPLMAKLAKGGLIMKYGKLQPGPIVGQKIEEVKLQIISGKIKNEKDLARYLKIC